MHSAFSIGASGRLVGDAQERGVFLRVGRLAPEDREVRLIPDFDFGKVVAEVGDDGLDEAPVGLQMLACRLGPAGRGKEDGQRNEAVALAVGDDGVVIGEVEGGVGARLDAPPVEVEADMTDARRRDGGALRVAPRAVAVALEMGADAVGRWRVACRRDRGGERHRSDE